MKAIVVLAILLTGCGYWPPWDKPKAKPAPTDSLTADQVSQLENIEAATRSWAKTCSGGITCFDGSDGDSVIYAGIACLSGQTGQCAAVRASQSSDGKLWRAPDRVHVDTSNSSSRDMLLGGLAYIVATKDTAFATKLVSYIHSHGDKLCDDADDNRCDLGMPVYSEIWGTMAKIWQYIGLDPDSTMKLGTFGESEILAFESEFSPTGYQEHLPMVEILIRQHVGGWDQALENAAASVAGAQLQNPFYEYVAHGATQQAAKLTIDECSGPEPTSKSYWTWQEDDTRQVWTSRNGWDCITMIGFLTGD